MFYVTVVTSYATDKIGCYGYVGNSVAKFPLPS